MKVYRLDNELLRRTRHHKSGIMIFQVCDKNGVIRDPVRNENGFITDYGTRLVFNRINELEEV